MKYTLIIFALSTFASASELNGTWHLSKTECSSGAAYQAFGPHADGKLSLTSTITDTQVEMKSDVSLKYKKEYITEMKKRVQAAIDLAQTQEDSTEKTDLVNGYKIALSTLDTLDVGYQCSNHEVNEYTVNGSTLHIGSRVRFESTCGSDNEKASGGDATFEIFGDTLVVKEVEVQTSPNDVCPIGDNLIYTFTKLE